MTRSAQNRLLVTRIRLLTFMGKSLVFLMLLLAVNKLVNENYVKLVFTKSYIYRGDAQFEQVKDDVSYLVAGDSHAQTAVDPSYFPGSFNLSSQGELMVNTYYRLKHYIEEEELDIKLVVLEVDIHTFSSVPDERYIENYYWRKFVNYVELGRMAKDLGRFVQYRLSGEFSYMDGLDVSIKLYKEHLRGESRSYPLVQGHLVRKGDYSKANDPIESARKKVQFHLQTPRRFDPLMSGYFVRTLDLLREHGIEVVLVRYPVAREYYRIVDTKMDIAEYYDSLDTLLADNQFEYPILDYHDLFWGKNKYLANEDHLNQSGAEEFTQILVGDLKELGLLP